MSNSVIDTAQPSAKADRALPFPSFSLPCVKRKGFRLKLSAALWGLFQPYDITWCEVISSYRRPILCSLAYTNYLCVT